ncbi:hypothetical protein SLA2020_329140 [Shorea laevis]
MVKGEDGEGLQRRIAGNKKNLEMEWRGGTEARIYAAVVGGCGGEREPLGRGEKMGEEWRRGSGREARVRSESSMKLADTSDLSSTNKNF